MGRNGGRVTSRVESERPWTETIRERVTEGENVRLWHLRRGIILGFDKDNPGRHEQEPVWLQQQGMESMLYVTKRKHMYCECTRWRKVNERT